VAVGGKEVPTVCSQWNDYIAADRESCASVMLAPTGKTLKEPNLFNMDFAQGGSHVQTATG
jgi:hypothetical protein